MARSPITDLPADYVEVQHLVLTEPRLLFRLNLLGLIPLILAVVAMGVYGAWIAPLRPSIPPERVPLPDVLMIVLVIVITLPLHELIHGLAITYVGHKPTYGMKLDKGVLYATADQALFRRDEYLMVALAPLVVITLAALLLLWIVPNGLVYWLSLAVVLNAGGAIGDLWAVGVVLRHPRSVLVRDEADGFRVFGCAAENKQGA
ncbi:MAG: DUF3267 domain-containing protein [Chloroflexi bacterium]|nr:DUF3267 domain-containing protein [Chloroflexota bacterium]